MNSLLSTACLLLAATLTLAPRAKAPPIEDTPEIPGEPLGTTATHWIAPYVNYAEKWAGGHGARTVTWFSEDGAMKTREVAFVQRGIALAVESGQTVVFGIGEPWKVTLPKKPDESHMWAAPDSMAATPDSRTFIRPFTPEEGQIAVDVYVHGVLTHTLGPFTRHAPQQITLNDDGSMAMLIWKDAARKTPQVISADRDGNILFRVDCDDTSHPFTPAPDGAAVVVHEDLGSKNATCYTQAGKGHTVEVSGDCIGWVPGTFKSLFLSGVEFDYHLQMIDWESGKKLWEIACPGHVLASMITITPRLVIMVVAEHYKGTGWGDSQWMLRKGEEPLIRAFYAVRVEDGHWMARGQETYPRFFSEREQPRLMQWRKKTYFLTTDAFSELNEEDILAGKNGWKATGGDK